MPILSLSNLLNAGKNAPDGHFGLAKGTDDGQNGGVPGPGKPVRGMTYRFAVASLSFHRNLDNFGLNEGLRCAVGAPRPDFQSGQSRASMENQRRGFFHVPVGLFRNEAGRGETNT